MFTGLWRDLLNLLYDNVRFQCLTIRFFLVSFSRQILKVEANNAIDLF